MEFPLMRAALAAAALLVAGCTGDISPSNPDGESALPGPGGAQSSFSRHAGGYYQGSIDASGEGWVYIDLDTQTQVTPVDPAASDAWDIAFKAQDIKLNGGVSGTPPGGAQVTVYGEKVAEGTAWPFDTVVTAPPRTAVAYVSDESGFLGRAKLAMTSTPAADMAANPITGAGDHGWYRRSGGAISARTNVGYVISTVECRYYKLRMTGYGDRHPTFDIQRITAAGSCAGGGAAPVAPLGRAAFEAGTAGSTIARVDASDEEAWVHIQFSGKQQVVPADAANDANGWDIALRRSDIKVNGGSSGAGIVEIHGILRDDWNARASVPLAADFHTDSASALAFTTYPLAETPARPACGGINGDHGWYYYSGFCDEGEGIHHISPREVVYIVVAANGVRWKLRMLDYYSASGATANPSFEFAPLSGL